VACSFPSVASFATALCSQGCNAHESNALQSEMPFLDALAAESKALWKLGFKQSSLHHIAQVLQHHTRSVSGVHRFTSMLLSSRPFGFKSAR
jgi:hypothetical protein